MSDAEESLVPTIAERPRIKRAARPPAGVRQAHERVVYLDNLKLLLVALIIATHGLAAYSDLESAWPYQDVQEVELGAVANLTLGMVGIPAILFVMGLFFLMSGLVTPGSLARKGPGRFARDRLVRLGLPLAVWALVIWPGSIWLAHVAAGDAGSTLWLFTDSDPFLDTGPMWFVELLLVYSLGYAAWRAWRGRREAAARPADAEPGRDPVSGRQLIALAAGISLLTVLVRPVFPILSGQVGQSHLWQWPQFVLIFSLGIAAARWGGLDPVPGRIRRRCGLAALGGIVAFLLVAAVIAIAGLDGDVIFDPGPNWISLSLAALEGPLAIGASIWLLAQAQRHLDRRPGRLGTAMSRSAYGAFILQGVVLIALMIALRPIGLPAEIKAFTVACLGVAGSFSVAWLLVSRTPAGRIL